MAKTFEDRVTELKEQFEESGDLDPTYASGYEPLFQNGFDSVSLSGGRKGGELKVPNRRLAVLWRKVFRVQFTDGGWRDVDKNRQLAHPSAYSQAKIVSTSATVPEFKSYTTHEQITTPLQHFDPVPQFYNKMVYLIRLTFDRDEYTKSDLMDDLRVFDDMRFQLADIENCSQCNPEIY
jgi:hypothetical protein